MYIHVVCIGPVKPQSFNSFANAVLSLVKCDLGVYTKSQCFNRVFDVISIKFKWGGIH